MPPPLVLSCPSPLASVMLALSLRGGGSSGGDAGREREARTSASAWKLHLGSATACAGAEGSVVPVFATRPRYRPKMCVATKHAPHTSSRLSAVVASRHAVHGAGSGRLTHSQIQPSLLLPGQQLIIVSAHRQAKEVQAALQ